MGRLPTCHGLAGTKAPAPGWGPHPWAGPCRARGGCQAYSDTAKGSFLLLRPAGLQRGRCRVAETPAQGDPRLPPPLQARRPPGTALPHSPQPPAGSQPCHRAPSRWQPSPPLTRPSLTPTVPARSQPRRTRLRRPSPAAPAAAGARAAPAGRGHRRRPPHHAATGTPRGHPHLRNGGEPASRGDAVPVPLAVPQPRVPPRLSGAPTSASARTGKGRGHVIHPPLRLAATSWRAGPGRRLVPEAACPPAAGLCAPSAGKPGRGCSGLLSPVPPPPPGVVRGELPATAVPSGPRAPPPSRVPPSGIPWGAGERRRVPPRLRAGGSAAVQPLGVCMFCCSSEAEISLIRLRIAKWSNGTWGEQVLEKPLKLHCHWSYVFKLKLTHFTGSARKCIIAQPLVWDSTPSLGFRIVTGRDMLFSGQAQILPWNLRYRSCPRPTW